MYIYIIYIIFLDGNFKAANSQGYFVLPLVGMLCFFCFGRMVDNPLRLNSERGVLSVLYCCRTRSRIVGMGRESPPIHPIQPHESIDIGIAKWRRLSPPMYHTYNYLLSWLGLLSGVLCDLINLIREGHTTLYSADCFFSTRFY